MPAPGMIADLGWAGQTAALLDAVRAALPECRTVAGMESLDFAERQPDLLPAAYVCWAGDAPVKEGPQGAHPVGQVFERTWLIFLVLELQGERDVDPALEMAEKLVAALTGLHLARGMQRLYWRGAQFTARYDRTRVVYSLRFAAKTAVKPEKQ